MLLRISFVLVFNQVRGSSVQLVSEEVLGVSGSSFSKNYLKFDKSKGLHYLKVVDVSTSYSITGNFLRNLVNGTNAQTYLLCFLESANS
ncbi:hypothetical protein J5N97_009745 [Dioscorea zingiberensis]|uniref:Uncharacterized protein n=1 Tax=Dioscorea zingiberensis TaxID=325984 RepID=A0A9D5D022_9LILI|nr:hypothetical protein J5N97_009745 [Dioscorea zingiberensis]